MPVYEFEESPTPTIFMALFDDGDIASAIIDDDSFYITAFGQILAGLGHLHAKGIAHRDLKSENFLIERQPHLRIVIADFGVANTATDQHRLNTFCGTAKYAAPEVFPGSNSSYGPLVDIWSLGVIVLEWLYGLPATPQMPAIKGPGFAVPHWNMWTAEWIKRVEITIRQRDKDPVGDILYGMIKRDPSERLSATQCLAQGFDNGLFGRRLVDGLVMCALEQTEPVSSRLVPPTQQSSARQS